MLELFELSQSAPSNGWNPAQVLDSNLNALQVYALPNSDGRLEVFIIGGDFQIYHKWQQTPGGEFNALTPFTGATARQIVVGSNLDGRLELIYVGVDHSLWHNWQITAGSSQWEGAALGGQAKKISLLRNPSSTALELLLIGMDDYIYFATQTAPLATTWTISKYNAQAVCVAGAYDNNNQLQMVYSSFSENTVNSNVVISVTQQSPGTWSPGISLKLFAKDLTFLRRADGLLELFLIDMIDRIILVAKTGVNAAWEPPQIFGGTAQQLCFCQDLDTRYELFYIGMDGYLYQLWQTAVNGAWAGGGRSGSGYLASHIAGTRQADGRIALFGVGHVTPPTVLETAPYGGLDSWSNYSFYNAGRPLHGVTIILSIAEDLVVPGGFSIQLNGECPTDATIVWQQYVIMYDGTNLTTQINNWKPADLVSNNPSVWPTNQHLGTISGGKIPKGYRFQISLTHGPNENVTAAIFWAWDDKGNQIGQKSVALSSSNNFTPDLVSPLLAYQVVIVGQNGGAHASFTSGSGVITYITAAAAAVVGGDPSQVNSTSFPFTGNVIPPSVDYTLTDESGNSTYQQLAPVPLQRTDQSFGTSLEMKQRARPAGLLRRAAFDTSTRN